MLALRVVPVGSLFGRLQPTGQYPHLQMGVGETFITPSLLFFLFCASRLTERRRDEGPAFPRLKPRALSGRLKPAAPHIPGPSASQECRCQRFCSCIRNV